jgi:four helix bundle protein
MEKKQNSSGNSRTRHYRELLVWQKAMDLARAVYRDTDKFPKGEVFGLQGQMRRAAVSIPSNVAEGHGRLNDGHFRQFLARARGSLFELQTQIELAKDQGFLNEAAFKKVMDQCEEVARLTNGLLAALR